MERTVFEDFYDEVHGDYCGNQDVKNGSTKRKLWEQINRGYKSKSAFEKLFDKVIEFIEKDQKHDGGPVDLELEDGDAISLKNTFSKGKGGAAKAAAFHYYFLCKGEFSSHATAMNLVVFGQETIQGNKDKELDKFDKPFVDLDSPPQAENPDIAPNQQKPKTIISPSAPFVRPTYLSKGFVEERTRNQDGAKSDIWLNPYNHHSIPLSGRDNELEKLDGFINEPKPFLICALVAPSGAGKTRLISEWMKPYVGGARHANWDAGIVKSRDVSKWERWEIKRNTLIVIDYTYNYDDLIKTIIERCRHQQQHKIRLLVIDHIYPKELFNDITWQKSAPSGSDAIALQNDFFYKSSPIDLKGGELDSDLLRHIIASVASLGKVEFDKEEKNVRDAAAALYKMSKDAQNPDAVRHPLFAALMGQALRDGRDYADWSRQQLLEFYFSSHHRLPWMVENDDEAARRGLQTGAYVGAATLRRGVGFNTLDTCSKLEDHNITPLAAKRIKQLAGRIVSSKDQLHLEPFEPDILGENFLLKFLAELPGRDNLRDSFIAMLSAVDDSQSEQECISNILGTLQRLTRNLANDDQTSNDVQEQWQSLKSILEPKNFPEDKPIRWAVSIALIDIVKQLKSKQLNDLALTFQKQVNPHDLENVVDSLLCDQSIFAFIRYFDQVADTGAPSNDLKHSLTTAVMLVSQIRHDKILRMLQTDKEVVAEFRTRG